MYISHASLPDKWPPCTARYHRKNYTLPLASLRNVCRSPVNSALRTRPSAPVVIFITSMPNTSASASLSIHSEASYAPSRPASRTGMTCDSLRLPWKPGRGLRNHPYSTSRPPRGSSGPLFLLLLLLTGLGRPRFFFGSLFFLLRTHLFPVLYQLFPCKGHLRLPPT